MKNYVLILVLYLSWGCQNEIDLEGKWRLKNDRKSDQIIFFGNNYKKVKSSDDLINESTGVYFVNKNRNRGTITISLIPDIQFSDGDTVIKECINLDIVKFSKKSFTVKSPTKWVMRDGKTIKFSSVSEYNRIE
jgi:hypothetical protein